MRVNVTINEFFTIVEFVENERKFLVKCTKYLNGTDRRIIMKKLLAGMLAAVMVLGLCACGNSEAKADEAAAETTEATETAAEVKTDDSSARTFVVGFDAEFPPYGYMDENGEYTGFDLELAQEVCNRKGWELVKQPIDWDAKDMELSSGAIDCIWNGFTMNGREDKYEWSIPYVDNSQVYVVKADSGISTEADLAGKVVGVQADSSALAALQDEEGKASVAKTFAELVQFADYNTGFMNLESGAIDCLALDIGVANYEISSRDGNFVVLDEQLASEQYAIGFLKGNTELRNEVENVLLEMVNDGKFMEIAEKYADFGLTDSVCIGK